MVEWERVDEAMVVGWETEAVELSLLIGREVPKRVEVGMGTVLLETRVAVVLGWAALISGGQAMGWQGAEAWDLAERKWVAEMVWEKVGRIGREGC